MILVDASVWIDFLADRPIAHVETLANALEAGIVTLADLTLAEILQGIDDDAQARRALRLLKRLPWVDVCNSAIALQSAENYRQLRKRGCTIRNTIDCLIATYCIETKLPLLANVRDFEPFAEHLGLQLL
jgi:predicted nucleic acid-binding protein